MKPFISIILMIASACVMAAEASSDSDVSRVRTFKVDERYMILPIGSQTEPVRITVVSDGQEYTDFRVKLVKDSADYLMPYDLSELSGKEVTLLSDSNIPLDAITFADTIPGEVPVYEETLRPQYHFSAKRGWINDPNGLVYHDGKYHLFFQYNPVDVDWGNLNWGHAESSDLVHWTERPIALRMGPDGEIYSGSAVVDSCNVSGLAVDGNPPMLLFYTLQVVNSSLYDRDGQMQCLAYSLDNGRTFIKYEGNPIIDTRMKDGTWHNRDPKVFKHERSGKWVMVLHEKDGHSIYNSDNLIDWQYKSHVPGFWECPELFELPVEGCDGKTMWVLAGASGTYMLGDFDGSVFTPVSGKHLYVTGYNYAAQTFNHEPSGRRIQIGWANIRKQGMPFTGQMLLPVELTLAMTKDGPRLRSNPVKEVESIMTAVMSASDISMEEANRLLAEKIDSTGKLRIKATIRMTHPTNAGLMLDGEKILNYDLNFNKINDVHYFPQQIGSSSLTFDMYIDAMSIETFFDGGLYSEIRERPTTSGKGSLSFWSLEPMIVDSLEVYEIDSIWK